MANIKSQIKRNKQSAIARERNKAVGTEDEQTTLRAAIKRIDKAAAKGVIHKNQAANKKSGLMHRIASLRNDA